MLKYRKIKADDDEVLAGIIRANLETLHLNIPGTAYFDPGTGWENSYALPGGHGALRHNQCA